MVFSRGLMYYWTGLIFIQTTCKSFIAEREEEKIYNNKKTLITFLTKISHLVLCRQFSLGRRGIYQAGDMQVKVRLWRSFIGFYLLGL